MKICLQVKNQTVFRIQTTDGTESVAQIKATQNNVHSDNVITQTDDLRVHLL